MAISVSDTGIGIEPQARERIFSPFEQAEGRTNRRFGGTGLGLAIARESALLLGGELQLRSEVGRGSVFVCYLPERPKGRVKPGVTGLLKNNGAAQRRSSPVAARSNDRPAAVGTDLLVVEDDPVFAEQLVELISSRNFGAVVAKNGQEALKRVREQIPVGIILDVKLPDIDGWTVLEQLRQDPLTRSIPVHFISALDAPDGVQTLGAIGYLTKPATRDELIRVIDALTRPNGQQPIRVLVVEDDQREGESLVERLRSDNLEAKHVLGAVAALEELENDRFSCVVLDLGLPDMDGLGFLETLQGLPNIEIPPVIVHTGRALTKEETRRIEAYAEAVVLKDGESTERLLDEIRLFVQHLSDELPGGNGDGKTALTTDVSLAGATILIADDDMRTVYALSALLQGKGAQVVVAENGREALDVLRQNPQLDVVLMDVMMPEMDGYEAMRQLRKDQRFATVPVIALTAKAMKGEAERCLAAGASAYLAKPVEPQTLLSMLASLATSSEKR